MSSSWKSPAIFAGLIGIGAFGVPVPSYALDVPFKAQLPASFTFEIPFTFEDFASSPAVYFVLGCLAGACVSGLIVYVVQKHGKKLLSERLTNELNEARAAAQQSQEVHSEPEASQKVSQPYEVAASAAADAYVGEPQAGTSEPTTQLRFTNPYSTGVTEPAMGAFSVPTPVEADASSPFVSSRLDAVLPHVSNDSFASGISARPKPAQTAGTPAPAEETQGDRGAESSSAATDPAAASSTPSVAGGASTSAAGQPAPAASTAQPTHTSEITTTYAERQANRKRGVFSLLSERLGSNMMDDIPVIERADGTVGDIGTSWWSDTMGNTMTSLTSHDDARALGLRPADETTDLEAVATISANARRRERARNLASTLPSFDAPEQSQASAPALQSPSKGSEPEEDDLFEQAMRNMEDDLPNVGITTSSEAEPTNVVPSAALGNFQSPAAPPAAKGDAAVEGSLDDMPTADLSQGSAEPADAPELRRKSWHVVAGGVVDAPQPSPEETSASHGAYRPKHMRRKQA